MSNLAMATTPEEQRRLERFYHYEARLLDGRQYRQWLALVDPAVSYRVPARVNVQVDNRQRGDEAMLDLQRELEGADSLGCPVREEGIVHLSLRVERAYKINSWSEHPPARTRRLVGNVELMHRDAETLDVISNFHLHYSRPGAASCLYSGQRRDRLAPAGEGYRLLRREVILDYADIEYPTLGLLF